MTLDFAGTCWGTCWGVLEHVPERAGAENEQGESRK